ncbi:MAG: UDP-3-O-(3-hydroxymyristoyl)glucosamine N-acyltransferase [Deltaproteobacteria bacterium]|nr:UDP-3-O-(3-hydroxymyristoyl)glucosamine N-acyltransferase [Deltaproteobacteria bacterium]
MEYSLREIADLVKGELIGDPDIIIKGILGFDDAGPDEITFVVSPKYIKRINETSAAAIIVPSEVRETEKGLICVANPYLAFAKVSTLFHSVPRPVLDISDKAFVGNDFKHGQDISVSPGVVIGNGVAVGDRVTLMAGVVLGDNVVLGDDTLIYPNTTILERCQIGNRVIIHAGSVIGSDGFGFAPDGDRYYKIPQVGIVRIDDDVEIGAGNTIDRATFGMTWIKRGVKTDNLVQIAHNVVVGENTVIVAQVGISGSVTIGSHVTLAGQVGVVGHITIGDNVIVGAQSGIAKSIPAGQTMSGSPVMPHNKWLRSSIITPKLPEMGKKIKELENRIVSLERGRDGTGI